jgi:hypothetical protein
MLIEVRKGRKWVLEHTTLQAGDKMWWIKRDQTAAFRRPNKNRSDQRLYNSFDNNDKFRFYVGGSQDAREWMKVIADANGLDFECRLSESDNHTTVFVFIERKGYHPLARNVLES